MHVGITWRTLQGTYAWVPPPESVSYPAWATAWILGFFFKSFPDDSEVQPRFINSDRGISCGRRDLKAGTEDPLLWEPPRSCCPHLPLFPKSTSFIARTSHADLHWFASMFPLNSSLWAPESREHFSLIPSTSQKLVHHRNSVNICHLRLKGFIPSTSVTKVTRRKQLFPESQECDAAQSTWRIPQGTPHWTCPLAISQRHVCMAPQLSL